MLNVADTLEAAQMEGNFTLGLIALTLIGKFIYPVAVAFFQQYQSNLLWNANTD